MQMFEREKNENEIVAQERGATKLREICWKF